MPTQITFLSIGLSPADSKVIWVGTDDGLVQVSRDGGRRWKNVTKNIPNLPEWGRITQIGVSPFAAGSEPKIGALFAKAELHRSFCGQRDPILASTPKYKLLWKALANRPLPRRIGR